MYILKIIIILHKKIMLDIMSHIYFSYSFIYLFIYLLSFHFSSPNSHILFCSLIIEIYLRNCLNIL